MITVDDVAAWFATAFNNDATLATLVPGDVVAGRINENVTPPYGIVAVSLERAKWSSGPVYYPSFGLDLKVYSPQGTGDATAIQQRVTLLFQLIPGVSLALRGSEDRVISMQSRRASARFDPKLYRAADVVVCEFAWLVNCYGRKDAA